MNVFLIFIFYSFIGYVGEVFNLFIKTHKFNHRGFLIGPYLPIYGIGALLILYIENYINNIFLIFIICLIAFTILEYFASYLIEKIFHIRLWDYSKYKHNINGRICLNKTIEFGLGGVLVVLINPYLLILIKLVNYYIKLIILILFIIDFIISIFIISNIKIKPKEKDSSNELSKKVKKELKKDLID